MKTKDLFNIIDGIDDDIILDIPQLKAEKPSKITLKKRAPFWSYVSVAAGFVCVLAIGIFAVTKIQGNITASVPVTPSDITPSGVTSSIPVNNSEPGQTSTPAITGQYYDDVFQGTNINPSTGAPMTYDEIANMLKSDPGHPEWDLDSLFLVETVRALTSDEVKALAGWDSILSYPDRTVYRVKVIKDLISGETVDRYENCMISNGNPMYQAPGDPVYAPGERFTVTMTKKYGERDYLMSPAGFAFRYDAVETEDGIMLYSRSSDLDKLNIPGSENISKQVITSTTQNPAIYTQKISLDDFAEFFRKDWEQRGISVHFEDNSNSGNENPANPGTSQPGDPNAYYDTELADYSEAKELIKFIDVPAPSDDEQNGIHGYEIGYIMPSKTPFEVMCKFTYGVVCIRDNSIVTLAPSSESGLYKRIEYGGRVFWRDISDNLGATIIYISEDNVSYTALFMDETYAIEKIISLL